MLREHGLNFKCHTMDEEQRCTKFKTINLCGSFVCRNQDCSQKTQKHNNIKTIVRMYPKSLYSAKVMHQACNRCGLLNKPIFGDTYAIGVSKCIKSWNGIVIKPTERLKKNKKNIKLLTAQTKSYVLNKRITQSFSLYPELHTDVCDHFDDDNIEFLFKTEDDDSNWVECWKTNVVGEFKCNNPKCHKTGWSSGIIATLIRLYPENFYNARVYHQRCRACYSLSRPELDWSYAERVSRRLKIWSGVDVDPINALTKFTPPHDEDNCEGCAHGACIRSYSGPRLF